MTRIPSLDPRAQKTRESLQTAIKDLLRIKPFSKITITDITERAGIARHTFYNHYDTKQDLLNYLVDSVLEDFFAEIGGWELFLMNPAQELSRYTAFFKAWKDNADITGLLRTSNMELVILERLKDFFTRFYEQKVKEEMPEVDPKFSTYVISFNAYSLVGLLKPWVETGMVDPPQRLGEFLILLTGARQRFKVVQAYQKAFSE